MQHAALSKDYATYLPPVWAVYLIALFFIVFGLGAYPVLDNNEGLYAEIPREMLASDTWRYWVIPHLNGLAYMEKPPLLYWLTACMFALFGESEWVVRSVPALAAFATVHLILQYANTIAREKAGRFAALIFVSGLGVMAMSRTLMFDMLLTFFLTLAFLMTARYYQTQRRTYLSLAAAALALALLAKGFVAILLFCLVLGLYVVTQFRKPGLIWQAIKPWLHWRVLGLFFLIAAPWHIAASLEEPIFPWFYFINEHILRFLGKREPHDYYAGAWWYYLPRLLIFIFPWAFLLAIRLYKTQPQSAKNEYLFLFCAWLMPLFFFSISSAKANYYLVTVTPMIALHIAFIAEDRGFFAGVGRALLAYGIPVIAFILALYAQTQGMPKLANLTWQGIGLIDFLRVMLWLIFAASLMVMIITWWRPQYQVVAVLIIPVCSAITLLGVMQGMAEQVSTRELSTYLMQQNRGRHVFLYRVFEQQSSLPFYLKKPVQIVDTRSNDLFWGHRLFPENQIVLSDYAFDQYSDKQAIALVVIDQELKNFDQEIYFKKYKFLKKIGNSSVFVN